MKISVIYPAIICMTLSACASPIRSYNQPGSKKTASLSIQNHAPDNVLFHIYKVGKDCSGGELKITPKGVLNPGEKRSIRIKSKRAFSFILQYQHVTGTCNMIGTFTPHAGKQYISQFFVYNKKCYIKFNSTHKGKNFRVPSFRLRKRHINSLGLTHSQCS